jgi:hypothetical protein
MVGDEAGVKASVMAKAMDRPLTTPFAEVSSKKSTATVEPLCFHGQPSHCRV